MKNIKKVLFFIWVLVFQISIICNTLAKENNDQLIKIGYMEFSDFNKIDKEGNASGYAYEYIKKLEKKGNIKIKLISGSWDGIVKSLENGNLDLIMLGHITEKRKKKYDFSRYSMGYSKGIVYTEPKNEIYYQDYKNFNNKKIGYSCDPLGERFLEYAKENNFKCELIRFSSRFKAEEALQKQKIDMIASEIMEYSSTLRAVDYFDLSPLYVMGLKGSGKIELFNKAQRKLYEDNPLFNTSLIKKYYSKIYNEKTQLTREEKEFLKIKPEYTVAVLPNRFFLSHYDNKTKRYEGIQADIIRAISKKSGIKLKIKGTKNGENLLTSIENKSTDMSIGLQKTEKLLSNEQLVFAKKLIKMQWSFVYEKDRKINFNRKQIIGIPKNFLSVREFIKKTKPNWIIRDFKTIEECFREIQRGDISCTVVSNLDAQYYLQNPRFKDLKIYPMPVMDNSMNLVISSDVNPLVKRILDKTIISMDESIFKSIVTKNVMEVHYKMDFSTWLYAYRYDLMLSFITILILLYGFLVHSMRMHKKNKELDKANLAKTNFLARMSHDMRTPLSAVIGLSNFGIDETKDIKTKKYFRQIKESSEYLLELLTDVLDLQRLESENIFLKNKVQKIGGVSNKVQTIIRTKALEKNIDFQIDTEEIDREYYSKFDSKRVEQVLINLLNNAIKYTPSGGKVIWKTRFFVENKRLTIIDEISDNGIGISKDFQKIMFNAFSREKNKDTSETDGVGLGLSICKRIVDAMGAKIYCKSKVGEGTTFKIIATFDLIDKKRIKGKKEENYHRIDFDKFKGKKILICEDIEINAKIVMKILENHNFDYAWVKNGREAVEITRENIFHAILMDIRMPIMDGLEATSKIRNFNKKVPIIALSANAYDEDMEKSFKVGMNSHIGKPINIKELIIALHKLI